MSTGSLKTCIACKMQKARTEFYAHPRMADGLLGRCKECQKDLSRASYKAAGGRPAYEKAREQEPARKAKKAVYQKTYRAKNPDKAQARAALGRAVRSGKLKREPCEMCGTTVRVQAHHHDYAKPLDVRWLCFQHHREDGHDQTIRTLPSAPPPQKV